MLRLYGSWELAAEAKHTRQFNIVFKCYQGRVYSFKRTSTIIFDLRLKKMKNNSITYGQI